MKALENKTAIVTGGGAGIGLAIARLFAQSGARVLVTGRRQEAIEAAAASHPAITAFVADAGDPLAAETTIACAVALSGRIDILVNNAGAGRPEALADITVGSLEAAFRTNVFGPALLARAAVPHLQATRGSILNLSSTLASKPVAGFSAYAASKAALEHLTRVWALELAPLGIRVNAIASGPVESDFLRDRMGFSDEEVAAIKAEEIKMIPLGRRGEPDDIAPWALALVQSEKGWTTGQVVAIDGGFGL